MKQIIHCCFTSHNEVLFRDSDDVSFFINALASTSWKYGVELYADTEMSNHVHLMLSASDNHKNSLSSGYAGTFTDKYGLDRNGSILYNSSNQLYLFVSTLRKRMTRHFNLKYDRTGRIGERSFFSTSVSGNYHLISAFSYVLRNPLHHGVSPTPFSYPFSSVNDLFVVELGKTSRPYIGATYCPSYRFNSKGRWVSRFSSGHKPDLVLPSGYIPITGRNAIKDYLPRNTDFPDEWVMSPDGTFLRPCFEELRQTEMLFVSASSFQYNMFRKTDDKWLQEQNQDRSGQSPVCLKDIEPLHSDDDISIYLRNEKGGSFRKCFDDFSVCRIIDHDILPEFKCKSVYKLTDDQRFKVRQILVNDMHVPAWMVNRCL